MTSEELVKKIALDDPGTSDDFENNLCKFCGQLWAEDTFDQYRVNQDKIYALDNPSPVYDPAKVGFENYRIFRNLLSEHHDPDCIWVLANEVMRSW